MLAPAGAAAAGPAIVRDGPARFEVITPTLIRLEFAADRRFENRPTLVALRHRLATPAFSAGTRNGRLVIRTARLTLRYTRDGKPFSEHNLELVMGIHGRRVVVHPRFPPPPGPPPEPPNPPTRTQAPANPDPNPGPRTHGNLGGWARGLDDQEQPVPLHDGLISRDGWYLLDDSREPLITRAAPGFASRPERTGAYQDGYLFGYGHRYARGLRDLRALSGAAPLLPRRAFGNWYSKYWPYSEADLRALVPRFHSERVPLDVLGIDTDFKAPPSRFSSVADGVLGRDPRFPYAWNGWDWNRDYFPHPSAFVAWLHSQGVAVDLNVHPSIGDRDAHWPETQQRSGGLIAGSTSCNYFMADPAEKCGVFDWAGPRDRDAYFRLHRQFERDGIDFWWLDWCCDESRARVPGLTEDTWINRLYAQRSRARGRRWPAFSRIGASYWSYFGDQEPGAFAEHRQAIHFTGDAAATWPILDFESRFTAAEGNIGLPYVSHDIGSFKGKHLDDDMYVRWVQLGAFQPINRLHSNHGDRLPWSYPGRAGRIAADFLRLRSSLVPYLYTLARRAHDRGLPMVRGMYLRWPEQEGAYSHDRQYMLGDGLLVAPVGSPGDPATKTVWLPPGAWVDLFTGERRRGPRAVHLSVPLGRMPVFARAGAIVPMQRYAPHQPARPPDPLVLTTWAGADGRFRLYEDSGDGLAYRKRRFAFTRIVHDDRGDGGTVVTIGAAHGRFKRMRRTRRWVLRLVGVPRPSGATVNGRAAGVRYDAARRTAVVRTGRLSTTTPVRILVLP
jgi:Glycosyl hydrolases family 31 TIM-barrel domain/Glycosyl hydrolase family 31 C-terminal domain/Domain of unknown function (DUF5110)